VSEFLASDLFPWRNRLVELLDPGRMTGSATDSQ